MKIEFEDFKRNTYEKKRHRVYGIYFLSKTEITKLSPTTLCLYDSDFQYEDSDRIYLELARADTPDKALAFCNKYGNLTATSSTLKEISLIIETHDYNAIGTPKYDRILYNYFMYYQQTIDRLIKIQMLLSQKSLKLNQIETLFNHCLYIINNPTFKERFYLEFLESLNTDEMFELLLEYPLLQHIYLGVRDNNEKYNEKLDKTKNSMITFFTKTQEEIAKDPRACIPYDYLVIHKKDIINLANYVYEQILSFEFMSLHLVKNLESYDNASCWKFTSLATAIFFYFYVDSSSGTVLKKCANEYCGKLFACSLSMINKKNYCCEKCSHSTRNRKYKNRQKNK